MNRTSETRKYVKKYASTQTANEMSKALGVTAFRIYQQLTHLGLDPKKKIPKGRPNPTASQKQYVFDNYKDVAVDQMAFHTGFSEAKIKGMLAQKGLVSTVLDKATKIIFDKHKTTTVKNLSYMTGVSMTKIYKIMERYGLKPYALSGATSYGRPLKVQSFVGSIIIPIGYNRMSIVLPGDSTSEYIIERKNNMLRKLGVAV